MRTKGLFFAILTLLAFPVAAQTDGPFIDLPDESVGDIVTKVRPMVGQFKISDTEFVGEETPEELVDPLLTLPEVEAVLVRGIISATAEWCGEDWKSKSFYPFMREQRSSGKSEKQMAYIGALHGFGMGMMQKTFSERKCGVDQSLQNRLEGYLY
ncbi:MAG TPA: hypothetical protein PKI93_07305 [Alphaproteobacteria bacterium]|nr:hypothetical protein [Alphaproteobacteria bacterium]HNS44061.1 hypothetical protein [Alphaproteobacteria bacterium]